jgi:sulfane dehydrogenase subunit SoxC
MTRWETDRYTQLLADGKARQFQLRMETNSVITSPSGMMEIRPGYNWITGLAWSGHGKIAKVEVSTDAGNAWKQAQLSGPVLRKAQSRFQMDWEWDGKPTEIVSRSTEKKETSSPIANHSSLRSVRMRCFITTRSKPGLSTQLGR